MPLAAAAPHRLLLFPQNLAIYLIRFDPCHFVGGHFETAGIDCPATVARSVTKRQAEFFFGRLCARYALAALGVRNMQVGMGSLRNPLWPAGVMGSISHSGNCAAALALPQRGADGVGIDIEAVGGLNDPASLHLIFSARELACLRAPALGLDAALCLTLAFSAKESFFKAAFHLVQKHFDFDVMEVVSLDPVGAVIVLEQKKRLCEALPEGRTYTVQFALLGAGEVITCCQIAAASPT